MRFSEVFPLAWVLTKSSPTTLDTLPFLPTTSLTTQITFGTMVHVHELGFSECPKAYVFRGNKEVPADKIHSLLGLRQQQAVPVREERGSEGVGRDVRERRGEWERNNIERTR